MARWTVTDKDGHTLVILADAGEPIRLFIEPAGQGWTGAEDAAQEIRTKLGAAIGVAQDQST